MLQLTALKGVELEREILEAEYSLVTDKIEKLQEKVSVSILRALFDYILLYVLSILSYDFRILQELWFFFLVLKH